MRLTLTCLNLWMGGRLYDPIRSYLETRDSDILALQEVFEYAQSGATGPYPDLTRLNGDLGYPHVDFAPAMIDAYPEADILNGNAVLSKFPLHQQSVSFFDTPFGRRDPEDPKQFPTTPRNLQHVRIDTPAGPVNIFNLQGVWDLAGDNPSPQRHKMVDTILATVKGHQHVIVCGDTNALPTNPAMRRLEPTLTNVFGDELPSTFNMRRKDNPGYATSVVDMIYVSSDIHVIDRNCPDVDISDHLPLEMTFELDKA